MNLSKFLNSVDAYSDTMDKSQLISFVHNIARVLPESRRDDFLERMKNSTGSLDKGREYDKQNKRKFNDLKDKLNKIEKWEMCLSGNINEEWDEWYNTDEDEFLFEDPEGVGTVIESACLFIHEAIDKQLFKEGNEIAEILIGLTIMVSGEYQDYSSEPLEVEDLERYGMAAINYKKLVVESLYITYCAKPLEERANALYTMIQNARTRDISLEMIMQCGEELPELQAFLPKWIAYLGNQNTYIAQELLNEAIDLTDNADNLLESARAYYEQHPGLYEKYLSENQNKIKLNNLVSVGKEALEKINSEYPVRSRIALQVADITLRESGKVTGDVEQYWMEAFRSDTRVVHFLRIMMECQDFSVWKEKLQEINHSHIKQSRSEKSYVYGNSTVLKENVPDFKQTYLVAMLNGEYKFVKERGMNYKGALGWSASYMKTGLASFLLLLYNAEILRDGVKAMLIKVASSVSFSASEYGKGLPREVKEIDYELFWKCFVQSKLQNSMSESELQSYLAWIEKLVKKRVDGIVEGNHRKYYRECAEHIAALGEVQESRGVMNGKQNLMIEYKQCYSRRRAFHEELRNCGMKDKKK